MPDLVHCVAVARYQSVMRAVAAQFQNLSAAVETQFNLDANHAWLVDNTTCSNRGVALKNNSQYPTP